VKCKTSHEKNEEKGEFRSEFLKFKCGTAIMLRFGGEKLA
jgi:hypothetical protein